MTFRKDEVIFRGMEEFSGFDVGVETVGGMILMLGDPRLWSTSAPDSRKLRARSRPSSTLSEPDPEGALARDERRKRLPKNDMAGQGRE